MNIIVAIQTKWCKRVSWNQPSGAPDKPSGGTTPKKGLGRTLCMFILIRASLSKLHTIGLMLNAHMDKKKQYLTLQMHEHTYVANQLRTCEQATSF